MSSSPSLDSRTSAVEGRESILSDIDSGLQSAQQVQKSGAQRAHRRYESHGPRDSRARRLVSRVYRSLLRTIPETRLGDKLFSCIQFIKVHKRLPKATRTYNDVLYRIKTTGEILDPMRVFVSDKEFVKLYVKAVVGDEYNVPTIDVIRDVGVIDSYEFPASCCIKPTHASGRVLFRMNGEPVDREKIKAWFEFSYYRMNREANYKMLRPKVIVEPLIFGSSNVEDYKIFCVHGVPKVIQVDVDRHVRHKRKYFDADWKELDFSIKYPRAEQELAKPGNLSEMLDVAAALSKNFWFVRIDLYSDGTRLLVGEITHCADNADGRFTSSASERFVSEYLFGDIPRSESLQSSRLAQTQKSFSRK